jgi:dolichol-phosphate mannosyltransferase
MPVKLLSICIPVFNEESNIVALYTRLDELSKKMTSFDFEFVFTDNHSDDQTWNLIKGLSKSDSRIRAFRFSKNVGFQKSIWMNYSQSRGDAVIQIDADLQDPPELIESFVEKWLEGYKVVYGIRVERQESKFSQFIRRRGYRAINRLSEHEVPEGAGDFRLLDRQAVDVLLNTASSQPYLRGTIAAIGFKQIGIPYKRSARTSGVSKFPMSRVIRLGWTAVIENSTIPLRIASWAGLLFFAFATIAIAYVIVTRLLSPSTSPGYASLMAVTLFGFSIVLFVLGVIGDYLNRVYSLQRNYPMAVIEDSVN